MKLAHAIKIAETMRETMRERGFDMTGQEIVAVHVLVTMGKRVVDTRPSLRAVVRAVYGEDLNQVELDSLFEPPGKE